MSIILIRCDNYAISEFMEPNRKIKDVHQCVYQIPRSYQCDPVTQISYI